MFMNWIKEFFFNTWTITILTGVVSSVLAHLVISIYTKRKANRVRMQKISTANNEILYVIRPLVVDNRMPNLNLLRSLIKSTARKYGLTPNDLYTPEIIIEDLTKEIMENMFLPTQEKLKLCDDFDNFIVRSDEPKKDTIKTQKTHIEDRMRIAFMSFIVAIMTMITMLFYLSEKRGNLLSNSNFAQIYIIIVLILLLSLLLIILLRLYKNLLMKRDIVNIDISKEIDTESANDIIQYKKLAKKLDEVDALNAWIVYRNMGAYFANIQKNESSVSYYSKAIASFPSVNQDNNALGELYILRGGVMKRLGIDSFDEALSSIKKGLILVNDDEIKGDAYYNMGCIYAKLDDKKEFNEIIHNKLSQLRGSIVQDVKERLRVWLNNNNVIKYLKELE